MVLWLLSLLLLLGVYGDDDDTFMIYVRDFDSVLKEYEGGKKPAAFSHWGGKGTVKGAGYLNVTYDMTVGDMLALLNGNKNSYFDYIDFQDRMKNWLRDASEEQLSSLDTVNWWYSPLRDDIGQTLMWHNEWKREGNYAAGAFYGGDLLEPKRTLRSYGIAPGSVVLYRYFNKMGTHVAEQKVTLKYVNFRGKKVLLNQYFYQQEPLINVIHVIRKRLGIPMSVFRMRVQHWEVWYWFAFDFFEKLPPFKTPSPVVARGATHVFPDEIRQAYGRMKGPYLACWNGGDPEPAKTDYYYVPSGRYINMYLAYPLGELFAGLNFDTIEISDPQEGCGCADSSHYRAHIAPLLPGKKSQSNFGLGCTAHDLQERYCGENKLDKGDRRCWCPLKWCYVKKECGFPSKTFPKLHYSYEYCDNGDKLDCYTADDDGAIEETDLLDIDLYTFQQLRSYLNSLVTKLVEKIPGFSD